MNRISVISSNISSIGYNSMAQILEVEFHGGRIYHYDNVPENEYNGLMAASSHGKYLHRNIKGIYPYKRVY